MTRTKPPPRPVLDDEKHTPSAQASSTAPVQSVVFKPNKVARRHRKQMRRHPVFKEVLRAYVQCKRPVITAIPPLDQSEEVLFKEFADEDHHLLRDEDTADAEGREEEGEDAEDRDIPEAQLSTFLGNVLQTLQMHRKEIEALIQVRDRCCDQYMDFLKTTWIEKLQRDGGDGESIQPSPLDAPTPSTQTAPLPSPLLLRGRKGGEEASGRGSAVSDKVEKRRRENLPTNSVAVLKKWMMDNVKRPYPTDQDKIELSKAAAISPQQVSNWFVNARKRIWQSMLEDKYGEAGASALMPSRPLRALEMPALADLASDPSSIG